MNVSAMASKRISDRPPSITRAMFSLLPVRSFPDRAAEVSASLRDPTRYVVATRAPSAFREEFSFERASAMPMNHFGVIRARARALLVPHATRSFARLPTRIPVFSCSFSCSGLNAVNVLYSVAPVRKSKRKSCDAVPDFTCRASDASKAAEIAERFASGSAIANG